MKLADLSGARFGRLVVVGRADNKGAAIRWVCRCDCGTDKIVYASALRRGLTRSCGCLRREVTIARSTKHGNAIRNAHSGTYNSWTAMLSRVDFPEKWKAKHYQDRGITICERWRDFSNFLADMGDRPEGKSLDRIDNDKGYEPGNCRWATKAEQMRNMRRTVFVDFRGERMCLVDVINLVGVPYSRTRSRIKLGWPLEKALYEPSMRPR